MDLILFCVLVGLSLILIGLGFYRPEHTELPLIGFFLLFMLSLLIINQDIVYNSGENITTQYNYFECPLPQSQDILINYTVETITKNYEPLQMEGTLAHTFGYWLAIASAVGFIAMLLSLKKTRSFN